jgi:hypothetical protein
VLTEVWPIEPDGLVESLTEPHREIVLGRVVQDPKANATWWPGVPYLVYQVQRVGAACEHLFEETGDLEREAMAGMPGAMTERLVPAEHAPARLER